MIHINKFICWLFKHNVYRLTDYTPTGGRVTKSVCLRCGEEIK